MPKNKEYLDAITKAHQIEKWKSQKGLKRFNRTVKIVHEEGTVMVFDNAYCVTWREWLFIVPEHHPIVIQRKDELASWKQYKRVKVEKITD